MIRRIGVAALFAVTFVANAEAKTVKACDDEYKAQKPAIQASGEKKTDFITRCRADTAATTPLDGGAAPSPKASPAAPAPAQQPKTAAPQPSTPAPAPRTASRTPPAAGTPSKAGEYASESEAKSHCPGDTVVWANTKSNVYHFAGTHNYGNTKSGAYMCERDTASAGMRAAKNEKHP